MGLLGDASHWQLNIPHSSVLRVRPRGACGCLPPGLVLPPPRGAAPGRSQRELHEREGFFAFCYRNAKWLCIGRAYLGKQLLIGWVLKDKSKGF